MSLPAPELIRLSRDTALQAWFAERLDSLQEEMLIINLASPDGPAKSVDILRKYQVTHGILTDLLEEGAVAEKAAKDTKCR